MWPGFEAIAPTLAYDRALMGNTMGGNGAAIKRWCNVRVCSHRRSQVGAHLGQLARYPVALRFDNLFDNRVVGPIGGSANRQRYFKV